MVVHFSAFLPKYLFIIAQSKLSLQSIIAYHLPLICFSVGQFSTSTPFTITSLQQIFQIRYAILVISILQAQFAPGLCLPFGILNSTSAHPRMVPMVGFSHVLCFFFQKSLVSFQSCHCLVILHSRRMCFIESSVLQCWHIALCSMVSTFSHHLLTQQALCITFHRKSLIFRVMSLCCVPFHISALDESLSVMSCITYLVQLRLAVVDLQCGVSLRSLILWYRSFCVVADIWASVRWYLGLITSFSAISRAHRISLFTFLSTPSLPDSLLCPFVHFNVVIDLLSFRQDIVAWKYSSLAIPIQPCFSHFSLFFVSPGITYSESLII